jgi:hypothetical protein
MDERVARGAYRSEAEQRQRKIFVVGSLRVIYSHDFASERDPVSVSHAA